MRRTGRGRSFVQWLLAALLCVGLSVGIWVATIWNNFAFHNGLIADDYLIPVAVLALLLVVLGVNPLLRRVAPRWCFSRQWLAVIAGVLFLTALPPSAGILRQLPFPLADAVARANTEVAMADAYEKLSPPPALFPDSLAYGADLPVIRPFLDELEPGAKIPWRAWIAPIAGWSGFVLPWFVMMVALAVMLAKYWQDTEKVPFPLLTIFQALVDVPADAAGKIPPIFRNRIFWIGCLSIFLLHGLGQSHRYFPSAIPEMPLSWNLRPYVTEVPWRYLPNWATNGRLFFTFIAVAFFLPNRTGFSIWSVQIFVAIYLMLGEAYFPPFRGDVIHDARTGTVLAFAAVVVWLARRHLLHVARCTFGRPAHPRDQAYRVAGWCFLAGCAGMLGWFLWVRVPVGYGLIFIGAAVMATLTLMRVVAETGLPLFMLDTGTFLSLLRLIPLSWRSLPAMYFGGQLSVWLGTGQRVCVGAVAAQALALNKEDDVPKHLKLGGLFMLVLTVALVCGWLLILVMSYHYSETPTGRPISEWGRMQFRKGEDLLRDTINGVNPAAPAEHLPALFTGVGVAIVLFNICQRFPRWPLHPIGLLAAGTWPMGQIWFNVFLGWLIRNLLIQYGGTKAYTVTRPFFIGVIMGELLALFLWSALAGALALNGLEYQSVDILPY
jgi:hypothetical protein